MVYYSTLMKKYSGSNKSEYGIFDFGKKIVKVEYTVIWYIHPWSNMPVYGILFDLGKKELFKVEYTGLWYIRPWCGRIYWNMVYNSTLVCSNILEYGI